jgi:hypothetical protein
LTGDGPLLASSDLFSDFGCSDTGDEVMRFGSLVAGAVACACAMVADMAVVGNAFASPTLGFESSSVIASNADASSDLSAGSHPFALVAGFKLNTTTDSEGRLVSEGGDLADVAVDLPSGVTVNPNAAPLCGLGEFATFNAGTGEDGCPDATAVGVVDVENVTPSTLAERKVTTFPIYDLVPPEGGSPLLGFRVAGAAVYLTPSIRTAGDYGLTVAMTGIPQGAHVLGSTVTLWGVPADAAHDGERGHCVQSHGTCPAGVPTKPLITLPTQCSTAPVAVLRADSWQEPGSFTATASDPLGGSAQSLLACQALDFAPTLSSQAESSTTDTPTGLTVHLHLPQSEDSAGLGESQLRDAVITLPAGMSLNLARANGLVGCPLEGPEGVELASNGPGHCPAAARIGDVKITTPFLSEELQGGIYVAQQGNLAGGGSNPFGTLLALYILAEGAGTAVKLPAEVIANSETGQLTLHLGPDPITGQTALPPLSFADLELQFNGGARAAIVTPSTCGDYTTISSLSPWSGMDPASPTDEFHITQGCAKAFSPSLVAGTAGKVANAYSPLTVTFSRHDGEQEFKSVSTTLPEGLLVTLAGVELCPEPQASLGTCGSASLIGKVSATVGAGPEPFALAGGEVYFTSSYGGGSFGLSMVMPVIAGPFNLGVQGRSLVIRAAIHVNRRTGQATVATDAGGSYSIPSILQGIVPQIKSLQIVVDRPQFTFNPSNCAPQSFAGAATSTQGTVSAVSAPFQSTGCDTLPFGPKLTASVVGKQSRKNGIGFNVKIVEGFLHESNAHSVKVELPKQLPSRLSTLQKACPVEVFESNPASCPSGSIIGTASAVTSVLPVPVDGPVYFVSHGGAQFPEIVMILQGYGVTIYSYGETLISKGITSSTFPYVPDVPIPSFELHLPAGPYSALAAQGDLCAKVLRITTTIVAYNGLTVKESPQITVPGCRPILKVVRHGFHKRFVTVGVRVPSAGRLVGSGKGLLRKAKKVGKAGTVTLKLGLSRSERRLLARRDGRSLKLGVKLVFSPTRGSRLLAHVGVVAR